MGSTAGASEIGKGAPERISVPAAAQHGKHSKASEKCGGGFWDGEDGNIVDSAGHYRTPYKIHTLFCGNVVVAVTTITLGESGANLRAIDKDTDGGAPDSVPWIRICITEIEIHQHRTACCWIDNKIL